MVRSRAVFGLVVSVLTALLATAGPAAAGGHSLIEGSGSSWAANAINQWIADVHANGLQVVFSSTGSASGRQDFANGTTDFAISDIGYQGYDSTAHSSDTSNGRAFAYLPIVAGGTSLPYQIRVNGHQVVNLRLSGPTIAKIFSGTITNWNDAAITKDNNGKPVAVNLPIIPVVHSEGSGSTYQFTNYLVKQFPSIWDGFGGTAPTEYFPQTSGSFVRENGSDSLMNFLTSSAANGAIGYDEYSYALGKGYPVAKVLNAGGYYTLPTQYNVAVALQKAVINSDKKSKDYLLQQLDAVYRYRDVRTYPISSYTYAIIPTAANDPRMTTAKRQTIVDYLDYSVCQGQAEMGRVGYSPLPINLVQASFDQVSQLHSADSGVNVANLNVRSCHNPTFISGHPSENYLAKVAPLPQSCDKDGAGPCTDAGNTGQRNPDQGGAKTTKGSGSGSGTGTGTGGSGSGGSGSGGGSGTGGSGGGGTGTGGGGTGTGGGGTGSGSGGTGSGGAGTGSGTRGAGKGTTLGSGTHVDPNTGQLVANTTIGTGTGTGTGGTDGGVQQPVAQAATLPAAQSESTDVTLAVIAGVLLLGLLGIPPLVAARVKRGGSS